MKTLCADVDAAGLIGVLTAGVVDVFAMIAIVNGGRVFECHL
jgi:hypothetical protein